MSFDFKSLVDQLSLEEKVSLLTGQDFWSTVAIPKIGLRSIVFSDGPSGVRGALWDERHPSLSLPSATAIASSWDVDLVKNLGEVMASEARRKGVDVILGPTINLHRSPLGGRHFECFSEDPYLSGELAASFVSGVQSRGVGATLKHYVANDSENDRFTLNAVVSEANLRENYLKPFEIALRESQAWLVMSAYNSVNGPTMSENPLLDVPLKDEWAFDGVVISDWTAVRTTIPAGNASTDLAMPGPFGPWGDALVAAVKSGDVPESKIDEKVGRLLLLAKRVGALGEENPKLILGDEILSSFARQAAIAGTVFVKNDDALPLQGAPTIAVIGGHAKRGREQGGGSATVIPAQVVSPLEGITRIFGAPNVTYSVGVPADSRIVTFDKSNTRNPATGESGMQVQLCGEDDQVIFQEERFASHFVWMAEPWIAATKYLKVIFDFIPEMTGSYQIGAAYVGELSISLDGAPLVQFNIGTDSNDVGAAILNAPQAHVAVELVAGKSVRLEYTYQPGLSMAVGVIAATAGFIEPLDALHIERSRATEIAAQSDVAIVFVGTSPALESEGFDRKNLSLPEGHDELVSAVAKVAKKTIVVVNAGSPVEMPWRDEVDAILLTWFPGQEMGNALAQILSGESEPGGRLPTSWPKVLSDAPVIDTNPIDGQLAYAEESYFGYRGYLKNGIEPLYPLGFGLGYTNFIQELIKVESINDEINALKAKVRVQNTGVRGGSHLIQIYGAPNGSAFEDRKLLAFLKVSLDAGEEQEFELPIKRERFNRWDEGWKYQSGSWSIDLCSHSLDRGERLEVLIS
jgi:beta-glucosidase